MNPQVAVKKVTLQIATYIIVREFFQPGHIFANATIHQLWFHGGNEKKTCTPNLHEAKWCPPCSLTAWAMEPTDGWSSFAAGPCGMSRYLPTIKWSVRKQRGDVFFFFKTEYRLETTNLGNRTSHLESFFKRSLSLQTWSCKNLTFFRLFGPKVRLSGMATSNE